MGHSPASKCIVLVPREPSCGNIQPRQISGGFVDGHRARSSAHLMMTWRRGRTLDSMVTSPTTVPLPPVPPTDENQWPVDYRWKAPPTKQETMALTTNMTPDGENSVAPDHDPRGVSRCCSLCPRRRTRRRRTPRGQRGTGGPWGVRVVHVGPHPVDVARPAAVWERTSATPAPSPGPGGGCQLRRWQRYGDRSARGPARPARVLSRAGPSLQ